jgi:hypothetical protein
VPALKSTSSPLLGRTDPPFGEVIVVMLVLS